METPTAIEAPDRDRNVSRPEGEDSIAATQAGGCDSSAGDSLSSSLKRKADDSGSAPWASRSFVLTDRQHQLVLQLEQSFPNWSERMATEPPLLCWNAKWRAIHAEMRARCPDLVASKETLMRVCSWARRKRQKFEQKGKSDSKLEAKMAHQTLVGELAAFKRQIQEDFGAELEQQRQTVHGMCTAVSRLDGNKLRAERLQRESDHYAARAAEYQAAKEQTLQTRGEYATELLEATTEAANLDIEVALSSRNIEALREDNTWLAEEAAHERAARVKCEAALDNTARLVAFLKARLARSEAKNVALAQENTTTAEEFLRLQAAPPSP
ncbi:hypothetical protein BBJ28_00005782 [Nothophytophthora sp. Chile5]|nr:hypothetical protein BBJ28_00005782 [Nothophytophthora sp. Chile5]